MKNILIVGTGFNNKGAQAMLFICVDEIKKRIPDANVYFATTESYDEEKYAFKKLSYTEDAKLIALANMFPFWLVFVRFIKDTIKSVLGIRMNNWKFMSVRKIMPSIDLIVDASGYNIGSNWDRNSQISYINNIRLANRYGIPIILMPQSFGPFNYSDNDSDLDGLISEWLKYPLIVYAREKSGYELLTKKYGLKNVVYSTDLVLQNQSIDMTHIFTNKQILNIPQIGTSRNVGIIPNSQCVKYGNKNDLFNLYDEIIAKLTELEYNVYLFKHSSDDSSLCKEFHERYDNVVYIENDFSCFEFSEFIKQFDFVVCSRYHGIVHSYKNKVPCISLGWADKYIELAKALNQEAFAFDLTNGIDIKMILDAIDFLVNNFEVEKTNIDAALTNIQKENCFKCISDINISWSNSDVR